MFDRKKWKAEYWKSFYLKNRDRLRAKSKANYRANKDEIDRKYKLWYAKNKENMRARALNWQKQNPDRANANGRRYFASKLNATPAWANEFFIKEIYHLASLRTKMLGHTWHVDHIVPLKSPLVCGLHVESNLQVIPAQENISKHNRYWPDMP